MRTSKRATHAMLSAIALACVILGPGRASADGFLDAWHPHQTFWSAGWDVGIPVTSLRSDWVSRVSPAGGQVEVRVGVLERVSVGIAASYNWFDQTRDGVVQFPDGVATGSVYRRFTAFGLRGTAHWYATSSRLQPFIGGGVGVVWDSALVRVGGRQDASYSSYLAIDPEVGLLLSTSDVFALYLLGRYQWTAATFGSVTNAQWVSVQFGMGWFF